MAYSDKKREEFVKVYRKTLGNVTISCRNCGIVYQTFYNWLKEYPDFKEEIDIIKNQERGDFFENALVKKVGQGDTAAIIFALKTQCKDRGYTERQELTGKDGKDLTHEPIIIEVIDNRDKVEKSEE